MSSLAATGIAVALRKRDMATPGGAARLVSYDLYYDLGGYTITV
jgi:hypothetical protein